MAQFTKTVDIDVPKNTVWEVIADFPSVSDFSPAVRSSRPTTERRSGVGARRHLDLVPFGTLHEEVVEWHDCESYRFDIIDSTGLPPFSHAHARISIDEISAMTCTARLDMDYAFSFGPVGSALDGVFPGPLFRRGLRNFLGGLKRYCEAQP